MQVISEALAESVNITSLVSIDLAHSSFPAWHVLPVLKFLSPPSFPLKIQNFKDTDLRNLGVKHLADSIQYSDTLKILNLNDNRFKDKGGNRIGEILGEATQGIISFELLFISFEPLKINLSYLLFISFEPLVYLF